MEQYGFVRHLDYLVITLQIIKKYNLQQKKAFR